VSAGWLLSERWRENDNSWHARRSKHGSDHPPTYLGCLPDREVETFPIGHVAIFPSAIDAALPSAVFEIGSPAGVGPSLNVADAERGQKEKQCSKERQ
jgi:hypothetical protein